ncbi:unnamed protein product [Candida verbasci]|uniref:Uncharacterized protein n=1 Tax=Candida verbasci TaxID=1227364 RepID=A0A9W4U0M1_9ASCO|nr:unnamed protein product [Candida verbasci]
MALRNYLYAKHNHENDEKINKSNTPKQMSKDIENITNEIKEARLDDDCKQCTECTCKKEEPVKDITPVIKVEVENEIEITTV